MAVSRRIRDNKNMDLTTKEREPEPAISCRLCGHEARFYGKKRVREKYDVAYYECGGCQSLQTEQPYWLEEAYQVEGLGLDVGACQRCLNLSIEVSACLAVLGFRPDAACLDYGSGLGLFSRLMRDRGYHFRAYDKFIKPFFMDRFLGNLTEGEWSVLTAFEVFEHMVTPKVDCAELFQANPDAIFFTTQVWAGQGLDWWYLVPQGGQHVFFFSEKGLQALADQYDYTLLDLRSVRIFLHNRVIGGAGRLSAVEKAAYAWNKRHWQRGKSLPKARSLRLHLLRDRRAMRRLGLHLFAEQQKDSFHWVERDFNELSRTENL